MTFGTPERRGYSGHGGPGDPDALEAITADPEAATILRSNLEAIAQTHRNTHLGNLVSDVLSGKRPPSALGQDPAFMDLTRTGVQTYRDHIASLAPDERDALAREARTLADETTRPKY